MIVMIANRDREDLFRLVLLDDETVEMRLDVARQKIEHEFVPGRLLAAFPPRPSPAGSGCVKVAKETCRRSSIS